MNYLAHYYDIYFWQNRGALAALASVYLPVVFFFKHTMRERTPVQCGRLFGYWNTALAIGSAVGSYYTLPFLYADIQKHGLHESICLGNYIVDQPAAHAVALFCLSKFLEFGDTLFVVFRKSRLEFLHYYHHITTCLYCWHGVHFGISTGIYFAVINLFVHSIMYSYYGILAFGNRALVPYRHVITVIQMGVGAYVIVVWLNRCSPMYEEGEGHRLNHWLGLAMYLSYGYLFTRLLVNNLRGRREK